MTDTQISAGCVVAWALWAGAAIGAVLVALVSDTRPMAVLAIVTAIAACTATVRTYLVHQSRLIRASCAQLVNQASDLRPIR